MAFAETRVVELLPVDELGIALQYQISSDLAGGGSVHHAMSGESVGEVETGDFVGFAKDRMMVRRHFVESCPRAVRVHRDFREHWDARGGMVEDLLDEFGNEVEFVSRCFGGVIPGK